MAWIVQKNGRWNARYRDGAGKVRSAGAYATQTQAQNAASAAEAAARLISSPTTAQMDRVTVEELMEEWWPTRGVSASTLLRDECRLRVHVLPRWGTGRVRDVTRPEIQAWIAELQKKLSASSVRSITSLMSGLMGYAVDKGLVAANPLARLRLPQGRMADPRFLTPEEVVAIADAMTSPQARRLTLGLAYTGCRPGELLALHWNRVNTAERLLTVAESWEDGEKAVKPWPKTKAPRVLPISGPLLEVLGDEPEEPGTCGQRHMRGFCTSPLVFPSPQGHLWDIANYRHHFQRGCKKAGVEGATPYTLRHSYASWLAQQGQTLDQIGRVLGHGSDTTTRRYVHYSPGHLDEVRDILDRISV